MPPFNWPIVPMPEIQHFERRHSNPEAGALLLWAVSCVDALHYLDDLDRNYEVGGVTPHGQPSTHSHPTDIIDISHARWAVTTCATGFDLCAAALARVYSGYGAGFEASMADYDPISKKKKNPTNRSSLPPVAVTWIDAVFADPRYSNVREVRNFLTHSRLTRHFFVGGPARRLELKVGGLQLKIRDIITDSRETARDHVVSFVQLLSTL